MVENIALVEFLEKSSYSRDFVWYDTDYIPLLGVKAVASHGHGIAPKIPPDPRKGQNMGFLQNFHQIPEKVKRWDFSEDFARSQKKPKDGVSPKISPDPTRSHKIGFLETSHRRC